MLTHDDTYQFFDLCMDRSNFESVVLQSRSLGPNGVSVFTNYSLPRARRRFLTKDQNGKFQKLKNRFQIWQESLDAATALAGATLPCPAPKDTDQIVDGRGIVYTITQVENALCTSGGTGNVWNCDILQTVSGPVTTPLPLG